MMSSRVFLLVSGAPAVKVFSVFCLALVLSASAGAQTTWTPSSGEYTYALTCGGCGSQPPVSNLLASSAALSVLPNPVIVGGIVTIYVMVSGSGPTPSGQVQLKIADSLVDTLTLSGGKAAIDVPTSTLPAGTYPLTAYYSGDSTYQGSQSNTFNVVLNKAATTTSLAAMPNPVTPPANVMLEATVTSDGPGVHPTGSVTFYYDGAALGTASVSNGVASLSAQTSGLPAGTYGVTARYSGDAENFTSMSPEVNVKVN
jgi:hypothetical protein